MEIDDLYQDLILDHYKHPRHAGTVGDDTLLVEEFNPTCGDKIRLTARVEDGKIADLTYDAQGCAISVASASMMSEQVIGLPVAEAKPLMARMVGMLKGEVTVSDEALGDLAALGTVKNFPMRVKCATMCWHALEKALQKIG